MDPLGPHLHARDAAAVLALLLLAFPLFAQEQDRPSLSIPEPQRPARPASFVLTTLLYEEAIDGQDRFPLAVLHLIRFAGNSTGLGAEVRGQELPLRDPDLRSTTLLYMTGNDCQVRLSEEERQQLGEYLKSGGLLFAEDVWPRALGRRPFREAGISGTPFDRQFKALMKDPLVLGPMGGRWQSVPRGHSLYTCYFTFADGPPPGAHHSGNVTELEMLEYRGRVAVVFSDLNISYLWSDPQATGHQRSLHFGVNLLVFARAQQQAGPALR
jgi:hypothetical protein